MDTNAHIYPTGFLKMHGAGNDFVILDARGMADPMTPRFAQAIGDRHTGVGYDQLAVVLDGSDGADADIVFYNSDGSTAGACGNATRCVARLLFEEGSAPALALRTERGLLRAVIEEGRISVNMGLPALEWADVPLAQAQDTTVLPIEGGPGAVGMGNPHMVFAVDDAEAVALTKRGPALEHHPLFPARTNVEFCQIIAPDHIRMRVWERGTGVTLACGSGACAAVVALHRQGRMDRCATISADGGQLFVDWREDGVWLSGPTAKVFEGRFDPAFFAL